MCTIKNLEENQKTLKNFLKKFSKPSSSQYEFIRKKNKAKLNKNEA